MNEKLSESFFERLDHAVDRKQTHDELLQKNIAAENTKKQIREHKMQDLVSAASVIGPLADRVVKKDTNLYEFKREPSVFRAKLSRHVFLSGWLIASSSNIEMSYYTNGLLLCPEGKLMTFKALNRDHNQSLNEFNVLDKRFITQSCTSLNALPNEERTNPSRYDVDVALDGMADFVINNRIDKLL